MRWSKATRFTTLNLDAAQAAPLRATSPDPHTTGVTALAGALIQHIFVSASSRLTALVLHHVAMVSDGKRALEREGTYAESFLEEDPLALFDSFARSHRDSLGDLVRYNSTVTRLLTVNYPI